MIGGSERSEGSDCREETCVGIFGTESGFDCVTGEGDVVLFVAQRFACSNADLLAHEVDACDLFGHRVFYLQTRIHLEKIELACGIIDQELNCSGGLITDGPRQFQSGLAHCGSHFFVDDR